MVDLGADTIVAVWEAAREQHPIDRALTLLSLSHPERSRDELAHLPIGVRDRELLELRAQLFGARLPLQARCDSCGELNEFEVALRDLIREAAELPSTITLAAGDVPLHLPTSIDLSRALACRSADEARRVLVAACVGDIDVDADDEQRLAAAIEACDPQAEVRFSLTCVGCGHGWKPMLDIGELLFGELASAGRELLAQVHTLAHAYKWSEADILAMSSARRRIYLQMVGYE